MGFIQLKSRAKINLSIDVVGRREDGYSLVEMIMQSIDLHDIIKIKELDNNKIIIKSNSSNMPLDRRNIAYKAAVLIKKEFNISKGLEIYIEKHIPIAAGLAGGSSNAAAILVGLNKLWDLNLREEELQNLGLRLGSDVPFCISGRPALAQNIGEKLTYIKGLPDGTNIVVCKPNLFVSTKEVYQNLNMANVDTRPNTKLLLQKLEEEDIETVSKNMVNVLESVTSKKYKVINEIESIIMDFNALGTLMSGSGPTVFGIFKSEEDALKCKVELLKRYKQVYFTKNSDKGAEINV
ncbi:4-(cytidine 5'-diphospho)-2-C-methyl-D-erythritol kinase [Clostridioides mangenotii]|uniref:4-(cytidine 5'-diphospho)-2-C-methyl-D-erythritol kinase n=1 Tax=Metaclostridioides mangenotii TaxID=1540 RepID=UPI00214A2AF2|nr:4-(cytidine 5'-diphospho)-2-C-methyl-D-erythritol kinase [Clostridioides mangenotii]MCR1954911.1 4-(cytidine 5'-diphospho)-2-C-methyl-D-erythritol kinase [Clostridioides mangenotii]